jgi:hypothetical protein
MAWNHWVTVYLSINISFLSDRTIVKPVLTRQTADSFQQWADKVVEYLSLNFNKRQRAKELVGVTDLASEYLSHLMIAGMLLHLLVRFGPDAH